MYLYLDKMYCIWTKMCTWMMKRSRDEYENWRRSELIQSLITLTMYMENSNLKTASSDISKWNMYLNVCIQTQNAYNFYAMYVLFRTGCMKLPSKEV